MSCGVSSGNAGCGGRDAFAPRASASPCSLASPSGIPGTRETPAEARYYLCLLACLDDADERRQPRQRAATSPDLDERLLALCHQTTARVERITLGGSPGAVHGVARGVALDLGRCAVDEARQVALDLRARLEGEGWRVEAASLAPTLTLAELALLAALATGDGKACKGRHGGHGREDEGEESAAAGETAPAAVNLRIITPALAAAWLRRQPTRLLARLDPTRALPLAIVERLERYGLRTLGQVERLMVYDPQALRRHFGAAAGAQLTTLCEGRDLRALQPVTIPAVVSVRLRLSADAAAHGADTDPALVAIPALAMRLAHRLESPGREGHGGRQGRDLCLRVTWETGAVTEARRRLARPLWRRTELAEAARALLASELAHDASPHASPHMSRAVEASQPSSAMSGGDEWTAQDGQDEWTEPATRRIIALTLTLRDLSPRPQAQPMRLIAAGEVSDASGREHLAERERRERLARIMAEVGAPLTRRYGAPALYRLEAVRPDAILPEERLRLVRFDGLDGLDGLDGRAITERDSRSRASRRAPRGPALPDAATDAGGAQADVTPPQPHWW